MKLQLGFMISERYLERYLLTAYSQIFPLCFFFTNTLEANSLFDITWKNFWFLYSISIYFL